MHQRQRRALVLAICGLVLLGNLVAGQPRGADELTHLIPHIKDTCALVREEPRLWPLRVFPYGPLSLETRRATGSEAETLRNIHLGIVAAACEVPNDAVTRHFFCGPECPKNRRDHLVGQVAKVRSVIARFEPLRGVRVVSIWAPRGELRVNDVFVLGGVVQEAIPSRSLGLVPSGDWHAWTSLGSYLVTLKVQESDIRAIESNMRDIGLSAIVRDATGIRAIGVGLGDNESGLLFLSKGRVRPQVGKMTPDGRRYQFVEEISKDLFFYETT